MNYEVKWGDAYQIVEAGNPYQACMMVLRTHAEENPNVDIPMSVFDVCPVGYGICGNTETIPMSVIVGLMVAAQNPPD
jgi:hypothetical protein